MIIMYSGMGNPIPLCKSGIEHSTPPKEIIRLVFLQVSASTDKFKCTILPFPFHVFSFRLIVSFIRCAV